MTFTLLLAGAIGAAGAQPLAIVNATLIDGTGRDPIGGSTIFIDEGRVVAVEREPDRGDLRRATVVDGTGKYVIPGLMDANVHLLLDVHPEYLIAADEHYEPLILEAAQVALKFGVTTVFDTWGPRQPLVKVRDRIAAGEAIGSRIFLAGNIVGFTGPMSDDFLPEARKVVSRELADQIDRTWEQGVGSELLWMTPQAVRLKVREYIEAGGIDFVKYAASGHTRMQFITFSLEAQRAIVEEAHRAGLTAQAHSTSAESLRLQIEAGADLLQHCDISGPVPLPENLIARIAREGTPCAALVVTNDFLQWSRENATSLGIMADIHKIKDINDRRLIEEGAVLLLATDAGVWGPRTDSTPLLGPLIDGAKNLPTRLGEAHFLWLQAVRERGMSPMDALLSATRNIAEAYGLESELGTLEPGKRADLVVLNGNPLEDVDNYRRIHLVIKDGKIVDRAALPLAPVHTAPE